MIKRFIDKVKLYFHWCPVHGGWLETWRVFEMYKCRKGGETYYA